ncbi:MAG: hypothetical protein M3Q03_05780 [Chloroflexota bacterium]|nr:hypothetical protein [Chloroflexota bacterium]
MCLDDSPREQNLEVGRQPVVSRDRPGQRGVEEPWLPFEVDGEQELVASAERERAQRRRLMVVLNFIGGGYGDWAG